jgi:hypothetical protein
MARLGSRAAKLSRKWLEMGHCSRPRDLLSELLPPDYCQQFGNGRSGSIAGCVDLGLWRVQAGNMSQCVWTLILSLLGQLGEAQICAPGAVKILNAAQEAQWTEFDPNR